MNSSPQALAGKATDIAGAFGVAAMENYAEKVTQRKTAALSEVAAAELHARQVNAVIEVYEGSVQEDVDQRRRALDKLALGFDLALKYTDMIALTPSLLEEIRTLIERPAASPGDRP